MRVAEDGVLGNVDEMASEADVPGAPRPGDRVGEYVVKGIIGSGGMGVVLLARDEALHRPVAIKLIRPGLLTELNLSRFQTEARAMAGVTHPNVVAVYDSGEHAGAPYLVMEYVQGGTVEDLLDSTDGPMPVDQVLGILDQACRGVQAIHDSGIIHGDLKPSNLLIGPRFRVAVVDLGLAELTRERSSEPSVVGTPSYISPERATASILPTKLQTRADVYALGVIAFELLTGTLPFEAKSHREMMSKHVFEAPPRPSEVIAELNPALDVPILAALSKDPRQRTPSAEAFRELLATARDTVSKAQGSGSVLLIDDDPDFRTLVSVLLSEEFPGVNVTEHEDGTRGLEAIKKKLFGLAIVDLDMPGLNGVEVTAAIRAEDPDLPIIVVTGTGGAADWRVLQALGARSFFVKPLQTEEFLGTVRQLLQLGSSPPK